MKKTYTAFDHTSDLGIEVNATNMEELFINAALALYDQLLHDYQQDPQFQEKINLQATDQELLLHDFLGELLSLFWSEYKIYTNFQIEKLSNIHLDLIADGYQRDSDKLRIKREIKAVTYHQLQIKQIENNYQAKFVLDI
ncbi:MAG TPA: archease [bacterium]|nr:archease [bacterium]